MTGFSVPNPAQLQTLTPATVIQVWPECETCNVPYAYRRCWTPMGPEPHQWLWTRDCKHKTGKPVMMTADGPLKPDEATNG